MSAFARMIWLSSLLAADVPLRISSRLLLAFSGIGLGPIVTSLFVDLVLIVAHDTILRPSNFSFIQSQQPLEPSSFRLHCKIIQSSNRIIFEIVLMILIHQSSIVAAQQYLRVLILRHHVESTVQKFGFPIYRTYLGNTSNSVLVLWIYQHQLMIIEAILMCEVVCDGRCNHTNLRFP